MKQTTLTQSGAPGRVIGWTNFSLALNTMDFVEIFWLRCGMAKVQQQNRKLWLFGYYEIVSEGMIATFGMLIEFAIV